MASNIMQIEVIRDRYKWIPVTFFELKNRIDQVRKAIRLRLRLSFISELETV